MLFDSHAHLNFQAFADEWPNVVAECRRDGVLLNLVGSQLATSTKGVEIATASGAGVYASVGLHPTHVPGSTSFPETFDVATYRQLALSSNKVVALGETGIDFFHDADTFASQRDVFTQHLRLAKELDLAVVIHGRNSRDGRKNAYQEIYDTVKAEGVARAVVHCYGGTWHEAQRFLELGLCIGVTGIITFPKTEVLAETARNIPLDRLLIETDCPYLAPAPHRGKQNYPQFVRFVAEKIAELRGVSFEHVAAATTTNAKRLFKILA